MSCNKCCNIIASTSITTSGGITTITLPSNTVFANNCYCIGLFSTIPAGTNGTQVNITNGTNTYTIFNKLGNYWRPRMALRNRCILRVKFFDDPGHFLIGG